MLPRVVGAVGKFVRQEVLPQRVTPYRRLAASDERCQSMGGTGAKLRNQYFGTFGSISADQAVIPPLTLLRFLKPCWRKNSNALIERPPILQ